MSCNTFDDRDGRTIVHQPSALQNLALDKVAYWIASQAKRLQAPTSTLRERSDKEAEEFLSDKIELIRSHLETKMPTQLHNTLARILMINLRAYLIPKNMYLNPTNDSDLDIRDLNAKRVFGRMLEVIFTKKLTCLSFDSNFDRIFEHVIYSKLFMLTGLTTLELASIAQELDLINMLSNLNSLKSLRLSNSSPAILKCIVDNCQVIEIFGQHIRKDYSLNDNDMIMLSKLPNLKKVELFHTQVTFLGIATLLMNCKSIEHIITRIPLIEALEYIESIGESSEKQFNLKHYNYNCYTKETQIALSLIVRMCPLLQNLILEKCNDTHKNIQNLVTVAELHNLHELALSGFDFYEDQVLNALQERGCNLVKLELSFVKELEMNALMYVYRKCSNLKVLALRFCTFMENLPKHDDFFNKEVATLTNLTELILEWDECIEQKEPSQNEELWRPTDAQLKFILSNCPIVERLEFRNMDSVDDVVLEVMNKDPRFLFHLKQLFVQDFDTLSIVVIEQIVKRSASPLNVRYIN